MPKGLDPQDWCSVRTVADAFQNAKRHSKRIILRTGFFRSLEKGPLVGDPEIEWGAGEGSKHDYARFAFISYAIPSGLLTFCEASRISIPHASPLSS